MWLALFAIVERIAGRWLPAAPSHQPSYRETFLRGVFLAFTGGVAVLLFVLPSAMLGVLIYLLTDSVLLTLGILFVLIPLLIVMLVLCVVVRRCLRGGG